VLNLSLIPEEALGEINSNVWNEKLFGRGCQSVLGAAVKVNLIKKCKESF
jgi:hypothetical protein